MGSKEGTRGRSARRASRPPRPSHALLPEPQRLARERMLTQTALALAQFARHLGSPAREIRQAFIAASGHSHTSAIASDRWANHGLHRFAELLRAWFSEVAYLDSRGEPRHFAVGDREFVSLAGRFVPERTPMQVVQTLAQLKAIVREADGRVYPRRRSLLLQSVSVESLERVPALVRGVLSTLAYNFMAGERSRRAQLSPGRIERTAMTPRLPRALVPQFDAHMRRLAGQFIEQADAWLTKRELPDESASSSLGKTARVRAAVSVFGYVEPIVANRSRRRAPGPRTRRRP